LNELHRKQYQALLPKYDEGDEHFAGYANSGLSKIRSTLLDCCPFVVPSKPSHPGHFEKL
jgi:hypothetical protein